jgi:hypothetical protein
MDQESSEVDQEIRKLIALNSAKLEIMSQICDTSAIISNTIGQHACRTVV